MTGRASARGASLLVLAVVVGVLLPGLRPAPARAAEYTLDSDARYTVNPGGGEITVSVDLQFENTTPDPPGQFSVFETIELALQLGASGITAQDTNGELSVTLDDSGGFVAASVQARSAIRYGDKVGFTLTYTLPDGASPEVRVRPSVVVFPAWSFGSSGKVTVVLPDDYEVRASGSQLTSRREDGSIILESGSIADPGSWLAHLTATRPSSITTTARTVALSTGTLDLQVRSWADDAAWGERIANLLAGGLPLLESSVGLPFPRTGALVVVESVPDPATPLGEPAPGSAEIAVAFDEPDFTALHQAAHVWLTPSLASDVWIREGFASAAAADVATALDVALPYDPDARAAELDGAAFPLISWGAGPTTAEQDAWAYAASWALARQLTSAVGAERMQTVWQRVAAGVAAYEPVSLSAPQPAAGAVPAVDSRRLLDQLEMVGSASIEDAYAAAVFDEDTTAQLPARAAARADFATLLARAGDWGAPDAVRAHLSAWRFPEAEAAISEAVDWLGDRDRLLADIEALGLAAPARLRDRYQSGGGGPDARTELEAEAAVVAAYRQALDRGDAGSQSILARIGLLGQPAAAARLATAASLFAAGDLRGAADAIAELNAAFDRAELDGVVRLASVGFVVLLLVALLIFVLRRRIRTDYTSAP
jgi:hypothetical protein